MRQNPYLTLQALTSLLDSGASSAHGFRGIHIPQMQLLRSLPGPRLRQLAVAPRLWVTSERVSQDAWALNRQGEREAKRGAKVWVEGLDDHASLFSYSPLASRFNFSTLGGLLCVTEFLSE